MENKKFPLSSVLSITTNKLLTTFSKMHELAEYITGHPIWTHEFADKELNQSLKQKVLEQYPTLREVDAEHVNPTNYKIFLEEQILKYGSELEITRGGDVRTEHPVASFIRLKEDLS